MHLLRQQQVMRLSWLARRSSRRYRRRSDRRHARQFLGDRARCTRRHIRRRSSPANPACGSSWSSRTAVCTMPSSAQAPLACSSPSPPEDQNSSRPPIPQRRTGLGLFHRLVDREVEDSRHGTYLAADAFAGADEYRGTQRSGPQVSLAHQRAHRLHAAQPPHPCDRKIHPFQSTSLEALLFLPPPPPPPPPCGGWLPVPSRSYDRGSEFAVSTSGYSIASPRSQCGYVGVATSPRPYRGPYILARWDVPGCWRLNPAPEPRRGLISSARQRTGGAASRMLAGWWQLRLPWTLRPYCAARQGADRRSRS